MQTYKYHFPAYGSLVSKEDAQDFKEALEDRLENSPDCLASYAMFNTNGVILSHVSFDMDDRHAVTGINLHTYAKLIKGDETYLRECMDENLSNVFDMEQFGEYGVGAFTNGDMQALGMENEIPKTLYHIVENEYADYVTENGIDPGNGGLPYMNDASAVYMCEKGQLAVWLSVLKNNEHPVIMEVDTKGLGIEQSCVYKDRSFVPEGYAQYSTSQRIPLEAIRKAEFSPMECAELRADMLELAHKTNSPEEFKEVTTGMQRLNSMGILGKVTMKDAAKVVMERGMEPQDGDDIDYDDFADAVDSIPMQNGNLAQ